MDTKITLFRNNLFKYNLLISNIRIILLLLFILGQSCSSQIKITTDYNNKQIQIINKIQLEENDENIIKTITNFSISKNSELLLNDYYSGEIKVYHLYTGKLRFITEIPKEYIDSIALKVQPWFPDKPPVTTHFINNLKLRKEKKVADIKKSLSTFYGHSVYFNDTIVSMASIYYPLLIDTINGVHWASAPQVILLKNYSNKILSYNLLENQKEKQIFPDPNVFVYDQKNILFFVKTMKYIQPGSINKDSLYIICKYFTDGRFKEPLVVLPDEYVKSKLEYNFARPIMAMNKDNILFYTFPLSDKIYISNNQTHFNIKNFPDDNKFGFIKLYDQPQLIQKQENFKELFKTTILNINTLNNTDNIIIFWCSRLNKKINFFIQEYTLSGKLISQMEFNNTESEEIIYINYSKEIGKIVVFSKSEKGVFINLIDW
ncbi:MAG: hypothetical protein NT007_11150 [Candidatus Kapabacteria bacterium]|nr:hypothetical protein [Candidatus Kapabacteria bacterium]